MRSVDSGLTGRSGSRWLAIVAVAVAALVLVGALFTRSVALSTARSVVDAVTTADVYVMPHDLTVADLWLKPAADQGYVKSDVEDAVLNLGQVAAVLPFYAGEVTVLDADQEVIANGLGPIVAMGTSGADSFPGQLLDGALPTGIKEIALEQATAQRLGLAIGSTTTVVFNGTTLKNVEVTGIVAYDSSLAGAIMIVLSHDAARAMYSPPKLLPYLAVNAQTGVTPEELRQLVADALTSQQTIDGQASVSVVTGDQARADGLASINQQLIIWWIALIAIGLAALAIAAVALAGLFASATRSRAISNQQLLRLGASPGQVTQGAARQGGVIGLVGSVIGVVLAGVALGLTRSILAGRQLITSLDWLNLALMALAVIAVTVLVSAWAALRGARRGLPPLLVDTSADSGGLHQGRSIRLAAGIAGLVALLAAIALAWLTGSQQSGWGWALIVVVFLVAVALLAPWWLAWLAAPIAHISGLITSRLSARQALGAVRAPGSRPVGLARLISLAVACAAFLMVSAYSAAESDRQLAGSEIGSAFVVGSSTADGIVADSVVGLLSQKVAGTTYTSFGRAPLTLYSEDWQSPEAARVMFGPNDAFSSGLLTTTVVEGNRDALTDTAAVSKVFAQSHGLAVGDSLNLLLAASTPYETRTSITVGMIVDTVVFRDILVSQTWLNAQAELPSDTHAQLMAATTVLVTTIDGADLAAVEQSLKETVHDYRTITVSTRDQFVASVQPNVSAVRLATAAWVGVIAIALIVVALAAATVLVARRQASSRLLIALGASARFTSGPVVQAVVITTVAGTIWGLIAGAGLAWLTSPIRGRLMAGTDLHWPWGSLLVLAVILPLIAGLSGLIASSVALAKSTQSPLSADTALVA
ncbi:MAG: hypothetical protein LBV30_00940 [Propionibacteriaceae bacterium]|jgi:putative ABC transport system permease protein|nr:hypothetical protein [Propionibacteriaceae bacterium]